MSADIVSADIKERDRTAIIPWDGMIQERDLVAFRCKPDMTNPARGFIKHVPNRVLDAVSSLGTMDDGEFTFSIPIGPSYVFENFAR